MSNYKIYPAAKLGSVKLSSLYINGEGQYTWLDRDGVTIKMGQPPAGVRPFGKMISNGVPLVVPFIGLPEQVRVLQFWKDHPGMICNGYENKFLKNPQFMLEVETEVVHENFKVMSEKGLIYNQLTLMDEQGLRNIAFLMNEFDPSKMSREELLVKLCGVRFDGPAVTKKQKDYAGKDVLIFNHFRTREDEEKEMLLVIMKAINWSILKMENGQFMVGTNAVGSNPEEVLLTCRANPELYKGHIRAKVIRADQNKEVEKPAYLNNAPDFSEVKNPKPDIAIKSGRATEIPAGVQFFKGVKPELTPEEVAEGWTVESAGFGNYRKFPPVVAKTTEV